MAEIIDKRMLESEIEALEKMATEDQNPDTGNSESEELPDKYRNKNLSDIVRMHQEAEKALGRHANEVGELRKVVDDFITKQTELVEPTKQPEDIDFFSDPQNAVNRTVEAHPAFKELKNLTAQQRQATAQADMQRRHPDAQQLVQDTKFIEWVMASKIRQSLLVKADKDYDVDAADELFTTWKERQQLVNQSVSSEATARKATVKQASTGSNNVAQVPQSKKKYRRADIIKLMREDPDRYASLAGEIRNAYAEGRVI
jgi:hypothetical protein